MIVKNGDWSILIAAAQANIKEKADEYSQKLITGQRPIKIGQNKRVKVRSQK